MGYEEALLELRRLIGRDIAVNVTLTRLGAADGYVADFSGLLSRVDEPVPGVDWDVHYFRVGMPDERGAAGFAVSAELFSGAEWTETAGQRAFRIHLSELVVSVVPASA